MKVFTSQQGFYETVVAAPSQKAALEAWGTHQDLFAAGAAKAADDEAAQKAALKTPGVVLRRAAGSKGAFEAEGRPGDLKLPDVPKRKPAKPEKPEKPPKAPPDRAALTRAEAALAARKARYGRDREVMEARRKALEAEAGALSAAFDAERKALEAGVTKAKADYRRAGG